MRNVSGKFPNICYEPHCLDRLLKEVGKCASHVIPSSRLFSARKKMNRVVPWTSPPLNKRGTFLLADFFNI